MNKKAAVLLSGLLAVGCLSGCGQKSQKVQMVGPLETTPRPEVVFASPAVTATTSNSQPTSMDSSAPSASSVAKVQPNGSTETESNVSASPVPTSTPMPLPSASIIETPEPDETELMEEAEPVKLFESASSTVITVTKHPGEETVWRGGDAVFTSYGEGAESAEWRLVSPDYSHELVWNDEEIEKQFPGLQLTGGDGNVLQLWTIPTELDGWFAVCLFQDADGGLLASEGAQIHVNG